MPVATPAKPTTTRKSKVGESVDKSLNASTQARFTTSKLIQNLGSGNAGVQFNFAEGLRTAHGRD